MHSVWWVIVVVAVVAGIGLAWGWFEAGWLRRRVVDLDVPGLPAALDGVRIAHLSDFHLGAPLSRGNGVSERAARWVGARGADLVCITGDLVSHPRGEARFRRILELVGTPYVVLGNHDVATTRDPFSRAVELRDLESAVLLRDASVTVALRGVPTQIAGTDPDRHRIDPAGSAGLVDPSAPFRILLCHFPRVIDELPDGVFNLVLAGHLHAGQIVLPLPGRRLTLAHPKARYVAGVIRRAGTVMHISPGTGTTFVPFRFFARPEVTELRLRAGGTSGGN